MFQIKPRSHALLLLIVLLKPCLSLAAAQPAEPRPLSFGFLPSRSAVTLFRQYAPLRDYLSQQLKQPVVLQTAPDYPTFLRRTQNRQYDFVLTAPHFALLAIDSGQYIAEVTYTKALMASILVLKNSSVSRLQQLAGKKVSVPPDRAIITLAGKHFLNQHGLTASNTPQYVVTHSHNASIHAMLAGDTLAAIASFNISQQFLKKNTSIKKLTTIGNLPGMALLVARDLPKQLRVSFTNSLTHMHNTHDGKAALKKMGYLGYRKVRSNEFEAARAYLKMYNGSSKNRD